MNTCVKSAAIMMALIITLSVFTSLAATITVAAHTITTTKIAASNRYPTVGQSVTFTATLKAGTKPLSGKPITIYHYVNGVRYTDTTKTTNSAGQIKLTQHFASSGKRTYYATFVGDSTYKTSKSSAVVVTVNAGLSQLTLTASSISPTVGQSVTFTATLKSGTTPLSSKPVTIYHFFNGVRYTDTTKTTNANGQITLTQTFGSVGPRTYYATFAGDTSYASSKSTVRTINVKALTGITFIASTTTPAVNQEISFTVGLFWWNPSTVQWVTVTTGKPVTIYHYLNGVRYIDTTKTTNTAGQITFVQSFGSPGQRTYYATFTGDTSYSASRNGPLTITVH